MIESTTPHDGHGTNIANNLYGFSLEKRRYHGLVYFNFYLKVSWYLGVPRNIQS